MHEIRDALMQMLTNHIKFLEASGLSLDQINRVKAIVDAKAAISNLEIEMMNLQPVLIPIEQASSMDKVAARLIWFRKYINLSQVQFAKSLGVGVGQLNNWERIVNRVSIEGALKINAVYGLSLDFLYLDKREFLPKEMLIALASNPIHYSTNLVDPK